MLSCFVRFWKGFYNSIQIQNELHNHFFRYQHQSTTSFDSSFIIYVAACESSQCFAASRKRTGAANVLKVCGSGLVIYVREICEFLTLVGGHIIGFALKIF